MTMVDEKRCSGVTLIELLAVMMIIMILAGIIIPVLGAAKQAAREKQATSEIRELIRAWNVYYRTYTNWPTGMQQDTLVEMTSIRVADLHGTSPDNVWGMKFMDFPSKALTEGFRDPWGNLYEVEISESKTNYTWQYATRVLMRNKYRYTQ
ncbi:type II secretion system protein [Verrucomicrobiota bacterium]